MSLSHARRATRGVAPMSVAGWWQQAAVVLAASGFIALAAQIRVMLPFTPVPITAQSLAVLLVGGMLGSRLGVAAVLTYLAQGVVGLPVFQGGTFGWAVLSGPTGGYLVGFVLMAFVTGWLMERGTAQTPWVVAAMLLGTTVMYGAGLLQLSRFVGWDRVLTAGLWPFVPGDLAKIVVAAVVLPSGMLLLQRMGLRRGG